jgi:hypothetical protein
MPGATVVDFAVERRAAEGGLLAGAGVGWIRAAKCWRLGMTNNTTQNLTMTTPRMSMTLQHCLQVVIL